MTWDEVTQYFRLGTAFPDRDTLPKLLQKEFRRFEAVCRQFARVSAERKAAHPDPPKEPPNG